MPQTIRKLLIDTTTTGASPAISSMRPDVASAADVRGTTVRAIEVEVTGGSGTPTVQVEVAAGTDSHLPPTNWTAAAFRVPGGGTYAVAPVGVATGDTEVFHLDPSDYAPWIRANVIANAGSARVRVWVETEV